MSNDFPSNPEATPCYPGSFISFCNLDEEGMSRDGAENINHQHLYTIIFKIGTLDSTVTSRELLYELRRLRRAGVSNNRFDVPPVLRKYYAYGSISDTNSFCHQIHVKLIDEKQPWLWRLTAEYAPPQSTGETVVWSEPLPSDPYQWFWAEDGSGMETAAAGGSVLGGFIRDAWVEVMEDTKIVENAYCLSNLSQLQRGPNYPQYEPGPIVNAAGQQTVDPQTETVHRVILNVRVNYPDYSYALAINNAFVNGVHAPTGYLNSPTYAEQWNDSAVPFFVGYLHGLWKFLIAEPGEQAFTPVRYWNGSSEVETIVPYCPTTIKVELQPGELIDVDPDDEYGSENNVYSGWIRQLLNNGQTCFRFWEDNHQLPNVVYIKDPRSIYGYPANSQIMLFPTQAKEAIDLEEIEFEDTREDTSTDRVLEIGDIESVNTSEPVNLYLDGTQILNPGDKAKHIFYNTNKTVNLYDITDYYGRRIFPRSLNLPTFPLEVNTIPTDESSSYP